jgi:hypothetical protein
MAIWGVALVLVLAACSTPAAPGTWIKEGATAIDLRHAEAECVTVAGVARAPAPYAGIAAGPPRDADISARGREGYAACMESKGYSRSP